jgi:hypothetical protein
MCISGMSRSEVGNKEDGRNESAGDDNVDDELCGSASKAKKAVQANRQ